MDNGQNNILRAERTQSQQNRGKEYKTWKVFLLLILGVFLLWVSITAIRIWVMTNKLDHYIYEYGFVGPTYIVYGVPNADPVPWNKAHNGWDFKIPADTQTLFTSMPVSEKSFYASHEMLQADGALLRVPIRNPDENNPYYTLGGRSGPIIVDLGNRGYVEFWTESAIILCDPCPADQKYPTVATRELLREVVIAELTRRIQAGKIPLSALKILEYQ